ncbi:hypothetical protein LOK49_LG15G00015 [Camellia lanceoleosa]|uniref:Uncharacterized protein n=1 Tax=Camellia lanceoleosa TaxID=1840588 RepID=A0ACC0F779_9ERIC|nr:hypothetical protein LOK49_LG15G00015 [Camellia lanceoleosa]
MLQSANPVAECCDLNAVLFCSLQSAIVGLVNCCSFPGMKCALSLVSGVIQLGLCMWAAVGLMLCYGLHHGA